MAHNCPACGAPMTTSEAKPTEEDLNSLSYFWEYKQDVTRWVDWAEFVKRCPTAAHKVLAAVNMVALAEKHVGDVIGTLWHENHAS